MKGIEGAKDRRLRVSLKWGSDEGIQICTREVVGAPSAGFLFNPTRPQGKKSASFKVA